MPPPVTPSPRIKAPAFEFGPFLLEPESGALYRDGEFVALTPKMGQCLLLLVEEAGQLVTKEQILERVWPGVVVEEGAIANNISTLRRLLDVDFGEQGCIATVPRRGYRFTAPVRRANGEAPAAAAAAASGEQPSGHVPPVVLTQRDTILVADIDNRTGDPVFDAALRQALLLHLGQSPFLEVLTDRKALAVLGYIGEPGAPIVGDIALEIGQRTGCRAAIVTSIFSIGEDYAIGLQAIRTDNGDVLVTEQARAHGKGEVLKALDQAALGLREKLGESLASLKRFSRPFDEVATASLEALNAYAIGRVQWNILGESAGKPHYLRALELDPHFASTYSALAHVCANLGQTEESTRYMQQAYDLRDRATERERMRIVAGYHSNVTGDMYKGIDAHRAWEMHYPRDSTASVNLANVCMQVGQFEKALAAAQRAQAMETTIISANNLSIILMALGRHEEARAILDDCFARGFDVFYLHLDAYHEAFLCGDEAAMRRHVLAVAGKEGEEDYLIAAEADTEAFHGRHDRARVLSRRATESARRAGALEMAAMWLAESALRDAEIGESARARDAAAEALEIARGRNVDCLAALALARAGDGRAASLIADALGRNFPQNTVVQRYWLASIRAAVAIAESDWKTALDALEPAAPVELGITMPFEGGFMIPVYLRGLALAGAGRRAEAAREFANIVARPGLVKNFLVYPLARRAAG